MVVKPAVELSALEAVLVVSSAPEPRPRARSERGCGVRVAGVLVAVALALAMQTTLDRFVVGGTAAVDLVLVAVVSTWR